MASSYNPTNNTNLQYATSPVQNRGLFSKVLRTLSSFGMNYEDMIVRNQVGIGINEEPTSLSANNMYDIFSRRAVSSVLNRKSIPYLDRAYPDKRRILREYSIKDEIRDFISRVCDESIVYSDKDFASIKNISNDFPQDVKDKYQEYFEVLYNRYGFSDSISAWNLMKDFLIDGYIAMEIVWDDKNKNIIHFNRLRPDTLVPAFDPAIGHLWIQFPEDPNLRRIFLDSQIVFISYTTQNDYSETSYVEGLIKPYNQLKILEQTRIMYNVVHATLYQKFTIPVKGLGRQRAEEQIGQLIHDYSEEVEWDDSLGTLMINGSKHLPYNKQIWFPDGDEGTPNMELVSPEGHNLNESDMLTWFYKILKRASKIPFARLEEENGGGNIYGDASEMTRDEVTFSSFINRLRSNFKELMTKPLKLQMLVEFPELKDDEVFLNQIDIIFNSNHQFETWKKLANMEKKANIVSTLLQIQKSDGVPYFHIEYIMDKVWELSNEDREENKRYWTRDASSGGGSAEGGDMGGDMGGSPMDMGGGDMGDMGGEVPSGDDVGTSETPPSVGTDQSTEPTPPPGPDSDQSTEFEF